MLKILNRKPVFCFPAHRADKFSHLKEIEKHCVEMDFETKVDALFALCDETLSSTLLRGLQNAVSFLLKPVASVMDISIVDDKFIGELKQNQQEAVNFAIENKKTILALGCGLGKSPTSIKIITSVRKFPVCVVSPASLRVNWKSEFGKFAPGLKVAIVNPGKKAADVISNLSTEVLIVSYSMVTTHLDALLARKFDMIVFDEAHAVKHATSKRSKSCYQLAKKCERLVLLSGTPAFRHAELWNLLRFVDPKLFALFHHHNTKIRTKSKTQFYFAERYCESSVIYVAGGRQQYVFKQNKLPLELNLLTAPYLLRQKKEDYLDLPPLVREKIVLGPLPATKARFITGEMKRAESVASEKGKIFGDAILMQCLRDTSTAKLPFVLSYLKTVLEASDDEKLIIFFWHKNVMDGIVAMLTDADVGFIAVNGSTPMSSRQNMFEHFKQDPKCRVGVLSLGACSTGLNLQFVQLVLYAELTFAAIDISQSESRVFRIGQTGQVVLQYLVVEAGTDEMAWRSLCAKINGESLVLDGHSAGYGATIVEESKDEDYDEVVLNPKKRQRADEWELPEE